MCVCVCGGGVGFSKLTKTKGHLASKPFLQHLSGSTEYFLVPCQKFSFVWFFAQNFGEGSKHSRGIHVPLYPDSYARDDIVLDVKVIISIACVLSRQRKWESVFLLVLLYCRCSQYSLSYTDHKMGYFEEECAIKFMAIQVYYKHI